MPITRNTTTTTTPPHPTLLPSSPGCLTGMHHQQPPDSQNLSGANYKTAVMHQTCLSNRTCLSPTPPLTSNQTWPTHVHGHAHCAVLCGVLCFSLGKARQFRSHHSHSQSEVRSRGTPCLMVNLVRAPAEVGPGFMTPPLRLAKWAMVPPKSSSLYSQVNV